MNKIHKKELIREYRELKERYEKFSDYLYKEDPNDQTYSRLDSPIKLLQQQLTAMNDYLECLEMRAYYNGIDLEDEEK